MKALSAKEALPARAPLQDSIIWRHKWNREGIQVKAIDRPTLINRMDEMKKNEIQKEGYYDPLGSFDEENLRFL